ncbi:MAG: ATP-dependent zinc metalloprotease FtsH [Polyangiaceae bacterium]
MNRTTSGPRLERPVGPAKPTQPAQHPSPFSWSSVLFGLLTLWAFQQFVLVPIAMQKEQVPYSEFKQKLRAGQVVDATIGSSRIVGHLKNSHSDKDPPIPFDAVAAPQGDTKLYEELDAAQVKYSVEAPPSPLSGILLEWVLPFAVMVGLYSVAVRRLGGGSAGGGMGSLFGVGRSKASEVKPEEIGVTFKDVGGADEAISELQEIIQFLKAPQKFARLGGRIPKGVLLVGPPGTGKTLLAKATAGEAGVGFFETSGSEFVEMFVGVGAARVRDLFEQARKVAPAIVFIDEIDAIGQSRANAARLGGNDEREQTLNQLLAEIDGFKTRTAKPVILMAASNRPEVLDPALLRAGRFDRQVTVGNPDLAGRVQILRIHAKGVRLSPDFDIEAAARMTAGFSGADLANVVNEAALLAARRNADAVALPDFETAIERIVAGMEKKSRVMNEQERTTVAYHETGHALVAELVPHGDPVSKISIVPRSRGALGYTMQLPAEDRFLLTVDELNDRIAVMLGGRAAERTKFQVVSTGASDDIQRATELARRMVTEFGMSEKLGSVRYAGRTMQYLGGVVEDNGSMSPETRRIIDGEVQRIVSDQFERALSLLAGHRPALEILAQQLLAQETLDGSAVRQVLAAATPPT